jgi:hypothetical protein
MKILLSVLLIAHGLIVAAQGGGSFGAGIPSDIQNPSFVSWWPVNMGRSWVFTWLGLDQVPAVYRLGGILWLVGGIALVVAGLGLLGFIVPTDWWRSLAVTGGAVSLFMLAIYLHPLMIVGTASSLAVLISLLWAKWPAVDLIR